MEQWGLLGKRMEVLDLSYRLGFEASVMCMVLLVSQAQQL